MTKGGGDGIAQTFGPIRIHHTKDKLDKVPSGARIPPDQRYRQFLKSTKYVALTLEMAVICLIL